MNCTASTGQHHATSPTSLSLLEVDFDIMPVPVANATEAWRHNHEPAIREGGSPPEPVSRSEWRFESAQWQVEIGGGKSRFTRCDQEKAGRELGFSLRVARKLAFNVLRFMLRVLRPWSPIHGMAFTPAALAKQRMHACAKCLLRLRKTWLLTYMIYN